VTGGWKKKFHNREFYNFFSQYYWGYQIRRTKIIVFWGETSCDLVDGYQYSCGTCCLHLQGRRVPSTMKIEAGGSPKTAVTIY
jgi:hypothetical protein